MIFVAETGQNELYQDIAFADNGWFVTNKVIEGKSTSFVPSNSLGFSSHFHTTLNMDKRTELMAASQYNHSSFPGGTRGMVHNDLPTKVQRLQMITQTITVSHGIVENDPCKTAQKTCLLYMQTMAQGDWMPKGQIQLMLCFPIQTWSTCE